MPIDMTAIPWSEVVARVLSALIVGCVVGVEREYKNRPAGMRTHVLVCLGAAMIAILESLLSIRLGSEVGDQQVSISLGRLSAQVISGVGFLGAGTIFIAQKKIAGLTTAASLWNVACLGLLIGFGYYYLAGICCILVLLVLSILQRIIRVNAIKRVEVKFVHRKETLDFINKYFELTGVKVLDLDFHVENNDDKRKMAQEEKSSNVYINLYTLKLPAKLTYTDIVNHLSENANVQMVRTRNV